jgi:MATE family multidrug resistance protein
MNFLIFAIFQRALVAESITFGPFVINCIGAALAFPLLWFLTRVVHLGYLGGAWGLSLYSIVYPLGLFPYVVWKGRGYLLKPQPLNALLDLKGIREFLRLSMPGMIQSILMWWAVEIVSFLAGLLPNPERILGASYVIMSLESMFLMCWLAMLVFSAVRVGFYIGAGSIYCAKRAAAMGCIAALALGTLTSLLILVFRTQVVGLFSNDPDVQNLASQLVFVLAAIVPLDALSCSLNGVMSGLGLQRVSAFCPFIGSYMVSLPFACTLAFGLKLKGGIFWLWSGVFLGLLVTVSMYLIVLHRFDWQKAVDDARRRIQVDEIIIEPEYEGTKAPLLKEEKEQETPDNL